MRKRILTKLAGWFVKYPSSIALGICAAFLPAVIPQADAQVLTTLYNFDFANGGYMPISDLALSGNTLYGTTKVGDG